MDNKLLIDILGWIGGVEIVIAYGLVSLNKIKPGSRFYQFLNLTGAIFLIINTYYYGAYPSAVVNVIWVGIALYAMVRK